MARTPISTLPAKPRVHRTRRPPQASSAPVAPTLVSASWDRTGPNVTLGFDSAIDVSGLAGSAIVVNDGDEGQTYQGGLGYDQPDAMTITVYLSSVGPAGAGETLTASADNGIVAADGGVAWAGVTDLALPFP